MEAELVNHFSGLLKEPEEDCEVATQAIVNSISTRVSPQHNHNLMFPNTMEEVYQTIKEMEGR